MAARSIASLTLSFGLVSIPVKLYNATEPSSTVRFNYLDKDGSRLKQQYVSEQTGKVVPREEMLKGYEFEKDRFVTFTKEELKALEDSPDPTIHIVAFLPLEAIDPIYYDKPYYLTPDKRGAKPYNLLMAAMRKTGRCALATWAWRGKQHVVQVRPMEDEGLVLQQLLYGDEVRSIRDLGIEHTDVSAAELELATQIIEQIARETFEPDEFHDEEKKRILAAIDEKIAGKEVVLSERAETGGGAQVINLMDALRASLKKPGGATAAAQAEAKPAAAKKSSRAAAADDKASKPVRRAARAGAAPSAAPSRKRASK
ncbi:MAG TPA: Ku protein [Burkholderiaceae bacterium]|nr:Ku protein [Burkholderiaceae bacterium]